MEITPNRPATVAVVTLHEGEGMAFNAPAGRFSWCERPLLAGVHMAQVAKQPGCFQKHQVALNLKSNHWTRQFVCPTLNY